VSDDHESLIGIEGNVATSDEIMSKRMAVTRELGQFDHDVEPGR